MSRRYTIPAMPGNRANGSTPIALDRGKATAVLNRLLKRYPEMGTALDYEDAWQLLVVTVLSAQTTDESVLTGEIGYGSFRRHRLQLSGEMCDTTEITAAS